VLYRDEGVDEYWLVDLDGRAVERSTPADTGVGVIAETLTWRPKGATSPLTIDLRQYFATVLDD
jgi:hypothetical protein